MAHLVHLRPPDQGRMPGSYRRGRPVAGATTDVGPDRPPLYLLQGKASCVVGRDHRTILRGDRRSVERILELMSKPQSPLK